MSDVRKLTYCEYDLMFCGLDVALLWLGEFINMRHEANIDPCFFLGNDSYMTTSVVEHNVIFQQVIPHES